MPAMTPVVSVETMRRLDATAIEEFGIPGIVLMENAGAGAARLLMDRFEPALADGVLVLAGRGNNGGDGYVVARHLHNRGLSVRIVAAGTPTTGDARTNHDIASRLGIPVLAADEPEGWTSCGCVVDALLGVGFGGELREDARELLERAAAASSTVVAMDVPSGVDADTGEPAAGAIRAQMTITFGAVKRGLLAEPAAEYVGELQLVDISLPRVLLESLGEGGDRDRADGIEGPS